MRHTDVTRSSGIPTAAQGAVPAANRVARVTRRPVWHLLDVLFSVLERRKQRNALMGLDDHLLKDIGLSRSQVDHEVSKPFWRG
ncbi:DUF1127 domain-containing protein [Azospirillum sp. B510]|uniref:DUF1127 domain-containing protein n=1 Tax=Azospirillum sp. (strain B510) TaxID=137722 RepID=UPI000308A21A|nr:DUF1127 domain-containing protein [Azospirillum sp. B510]